MQTSLREIAKKARRNQKHRFRNLSALLSAENLADTWKLMNRRAAPGVDRKTVRDYEQNLEDNLDDLEVRLKRGAYHAKLVKRVYIPKGGGKLRPLGLPAVEDKLLQTAVARILSAIFEEDFLECSHGYRPNRGSKQASGVLRERLSLGRYNHVVEADIKGYFENIDHEWLCKMLELRIDDRRFMRLIRKWLKAGILETDGKVLHPVTGTPQGGTVSPVAANVYLHFVLDLWFEKVVRPRLRGEAYMIRYADDFVCAFQYRNDAERFFRVLSKRLGKFGLEVAADKTRIIGFCRFQKDDGVSFDFLGFEFRWQTSRKGKRVVKRRTSRKKFRAALKNLSEWCKKNRNLRKEDFFRSINRRLRGYNNYYGVVGNYESVAEFFKQGRGILHKWLNRRSQRRSLNWADFHRLLRRHRLERPRITEQTDGQLMFRYA